MLRNGNTRAFFTSMIVFNKLCQTFFWRKNFNLAIIQKMFFVCTNHIYIHLYTTFSITNDSMLFTILKPFDMYQQFYYSSSQFSR